ncbi:MAG TPA: type II toxin-antitoxin system VapC family toxin [Oceanipulchritudo sp.]|nr:type II toxin-antitoxin system VapC family toxin [Oceanipulchritudo sp.]
MKLCDVNVLVYAHRADSTRDHDAYRDWLRAMGNGPEAFGLSEAILSGFVRIVTNRRIFSEPTSIEDALEFCDNLRDRPQSCILRPGPRHWHIFKQLCREASASGNLVSDAWHAALAVEYDCTWLSADADYVRFKSLKWQHPLA